MGAPKGNLYALGNNGGRPVIFDDPELLESKIVEYFEYILGETEEKKGKEPKIIRRPESPTITGLTLYLGFSSKSTLYEYAKKQEFSDSIKRALLVVENNYEKLLMADKCAGVIFALKNMGWADKKEVSIKETVIEFAE